MDELRSARSDVISWLVMFVEVLRRRKSENHWGDAAKDDVGDSSGFGFDAGGESSDG
jgi:hypothetical protein